MLRNYSSMMSTLAMVVALILGIGGVILAIVMSSFATLIYFAVSAGLFYLILRSLSLLMEATADNGDALAEIRKTLHALSAAPAVTPSQPAAAPQQPHQVISHQPAAKTAPAATPAVKGDSAVAPNPQPVPDDNSPATKIPIRDGRIKCSRCGREQPANRGKCFDCGAEFQNVKKLPNTGSFAAKIPTADGRIRCSKCGHVQPAGQIQCYECGAQFQ